MARHHEILAFALIAALAGAERVRADTCDVERAALGVAVGVKRGVVSVAAVDPDSPAARGGFRVGDVIVQVNDVLPHSCAHWSGAVETARDRRAAVLVLLQREAQQVPVVIGATAWGPEPTVPPEAAEAETEPAPAGKPRLVEAPPPPPPPLPPETPVSVDGVLAELQKLAPPDEPPDSLPAYRESLLQVRREVETLAARNAAPESTVAGLRDLLRYYEGAEVAWDAMEGDREREHRSRRLPIAEGATVDYFTGSRAATVIDEFDFLAATVSRPPRPAALGTELSGKWRPAIARLLLWDQGAKELERLRAGTPP